MKITGWILLIIGGLALAPDIHLMEYHQAVAVVLKSILGMTLLIVGSSFIDEAKRVKND